MTQITDPYAELGVDRNAGSDEINRAYRAQARKHHPDKGGDREKFDRIGTAVAILRDPDKRAKFDRTGAVDDRAEQDQRTQAFALINGHLGVIVNEYISSQFDPSKNPEALDVVTIVRHMIRLEVEQARQNSHVGHKHVALLERMKRRLKRKKKAKGSDLIAAAMDHQIANSRRQLEALTETIELRNCALELLDDYTFEVDRVAPTMPMYATGLWPGFNGTST